MMIIFGTLLPLSFRMMAGLEEKKHEMRAKETLFQGSLLYTNYQYTNGVRTENGTDYYWRVESGRICVSYSSSGLTGEVCTP